MNTNVIVPCAGRSTRFNAQKPKYMLTHPSGCLMLEASLAQLNYQQVDKIYITVVRAHLEQTKINLDKVQNALCHRLNQEIIFYILEDFTTSQSDTVAQTILGNHLEGTIFVKDCDNMFSTKISNKNAICYAELTANTNAINKSYILTDKMGMVSGIIEKQVVSNRFCVGGYSFEDASKFINTFQQIRGIKHINQSEIYISHVVQQMLLDGAQFEPQSVLDYVDWGTRQDWTQYCSQYKTIFCDLDGVLVENSSEFFVPVWGESAGIEQNIAKINQLYQGGKVKIIITTSRKQKYETEIIAQLQRVGINYHQIIYDLPHAQRILINDYSENNPYPSAVAINIKRNSEDLKDLLIK